MKGAHLDAFVVIERAPDELAADLDLEIVLVDDGEEDAKELDDAATDVEASVLCRETP